MSLRGGTTSPAPASDSEKFGKLRDMAFFKDFGEVELWEVVRIGTWQSIDDGTVLMRENDQGDCFYILLEGEVEVSLLGKRLAVLKPGSCFGDILYFSDRVERRTTTVTARGRITVIQIPAGALRVATPACQVGFNKAFMRVLVERLAQANRQLAQRPV
jgi:CRP-like cAMP-binding protein